MADDTAALDGGLGVSPSDGEADRPQTDPESTTADYDREAESETGDAAAAVATRLSPVRLAFAWGLAVVVALTGLAGWVGYRAYQSQRAAEQRALFVEVGRQGAINLTTIDYEHADTDVQRILDSATGQFYDDFSRRSQSFVDLVKQTKSKSEGKVTEAGVESESGDEAQVLVAVTVQTSNAGAPDQSPRLWRMRLGVHKVGAGEAKVSNVEFVP
ncbi:MULTISPECIES: hypothetical protein [Mycolicibacter]|uniref:Tetratricopeptide repeat protein n=1 Tax=Mycolicibacter kumamotonensis TaxID=354243 RepID=A0A7K3L6X5_9MYCO|nr:MULTISPECIES: hypothetical protein [Mycolicibacter]NDJ88148.1 tetratricopeptide repeat protein [Mycolicibacter kumamotonensis]RAV03843.1 hypothetical protein DQP56_01165 [Mycolicibacter senuensis]